MIAKGDTVLYSFPGLVDDNGAPRRAQPTLIEVPAIVLAIHVTTETRYDVYVFAEPWLSPPIVRGVLLDDGLPKVPNRNQADDRQAAIGGNTLDTIRDNVKGWVRERV